jgi:hypothetical protein
MKPFGFEYKFVPGSQKVISIKIQRLVRIPNENKIDETFKIRRISYRLQFSSL